MFRYYCSNHSSNLVKWNCEERRTGCNQKDIQFLITLYINSKPAIGRSWVLSNWQREPEEEAEESDWASWWTQAWTEHSTVGGLIPTGVNYITHSMWLELREDENLPRVRCSYFKRKCWVDPVCVCEWICSHMKREKQEKNDVGVLWEHQGGNVGQCLPVVLLSRSQTHTSDTYMYILVQLFITNAEHTAEAKLHSLYW